MDGSVRPLGDQRHGQGKLNMRLSLWVSILIFSPSLWAGASSCAEVLTRVWGTAPSPTSPQPGFVANPEILRQVDQIVAQSKLRPQIEKIEGFNNGVVGHIPGKIDKLVRQETPFTVSLLGRELTQEISAVRDFAQLGFVYGDPHFGNSNVQPNLFRGRDRNRYEVVDLDEVTVGVFSLDFARYAIFLKARYGKLDKTFGKGFEDQLFSAYHRGLRQDQGFPTPSFIQKALDATPIEIRSKVDRYAKARTENDGLFRKKLYRDGEILEFTTKNMKPRFLETMGFDRKTEDRKLFKKLLFEKMVSAAQHELGFHIKVLDVAIPVREGGGSVDLQRFLLSTEVSLDGQTYRLILEFKENADRSAWEAVVETPLISAADRYRMALQVTTADGGPLLKIVELNPAVSFLMRPKGNVDIVPESKSEAHNLALYNAYAMGLFHGSQGTDSSKAYVKAVTENPTGFQSAVTVVAEKVLGKLADTSGLQPPKSKLK